MTTSTKNKEIEFKYSAKNLSLSDFKDFCSNREHEQFVIVSGYDHFYSSPKDPASFYRHRVNTNENQLTFKRKLAVDNNFIREEHNIDLPLSVSEEKIKDLCNITGYTYDFSIFKHCFIYNYDYHTLVYYIVYDIELNELDRFIEIEMKEDYAWLNQEEAYSELVALERICKSINASPSNRVSQSLFEMYRKVPK